jgi:O-succinylbenzoate synthase
MTPTIHRLRLPLLQPLRTALGEIRERTVWLVHLGEGWGEAAPLPGYGGEPPELCELALERAADGKNPGLDTPCAKAALADARLDHEARLFGKPLAWGGREGAVTPLHVACNILAGSDTQALAASGTVKLKSCGDPVADAARIRSLHARRGDLRLRLDANGSWDEAGAHAFARLAGSLVDYVEQPLPVGDLAGCASLRTAGLRIALDEGIRGPADIARALAAQACDAVVLKPNWLGGTAIAGHCAELARDAGIAVILSSALGSAVERLHAAHLAARLGLPGPHGLATGGLLARDVALVPLDASQRILLGIRAGLGVEVQL